MFSKTESLGNPVGLTFKMSRIQPLLTFTAPPWSKQPSLLSELSQLLPLLSLFPPKKPDWSLWNVSQITLHFHSKPSGDSASHSKLKPGPCYGYYPRLMPFGPLLTSSGSSTACLCLVYFIPATLASLLFFKHARYTPASGPLQWLFYLLRSLFPQIVTLLATSPSSHFHSKVTFWVRNVPTIQIRIAIPVPWPTLLCCCPCLCFLLLFFFFHSIIFYKLCNLLIYRIYRLTPSTKM